MFPMSNLAISSSLDDRPHPYHEAFHSGVRPDSATAIEQQKANVSESKYIRHP